ncbi:MAG: transglutaminase-like domain-containing protein [Chitinophagaceae bacterium]
MLRTIGIPSRYVSGYICPNKNGMRGEGATHAWVEAFIPAYGWEGIDPTKMYGLPITTLSWQWAATLMIVRL